MTECGDCINLKHRYSLLTGMTYPTLQTALNAQQIKAEDFKCEGIGCKFIMYGEDIDHSEIPDKEWDCPYFEPVPKIEEYKKADREKYERIDSHANPSEYPNPHFLILKNGKIVIEKFGATEKAKE